MKICCKCKHEKCDDEFGLNKSNLDGLQRYCRSCKRKIAKKWYSGSRKSSHLENVRRNNERYLRTMQNIVWSHLESHACVDCGERDPIVLEFDHVRGEKEYNIASLVKHSNPDILLREIEKCDVRCANCHKRKTAKEINNFKYKRGCNRTVS